MVRKCLTLSPSARRLQRAYCPRHDIIPFAVWHAQRLENDISVVCTSHLSIVVTNGWIYLAGSCCRPGRRARPHRSQNTQPTHRTRRSYSQDQSPRRRRMTETETYTTYRSSRVVDLVQVRRASAVTRGDVRTPTQIRTHARAHEHTAAHPHTSPAHTNGWTGSITTWCNLLSDAGTHVSTVWRPTVIFLSQVPCRWLTASSCFQFVMYTTLQLFEFSVN